MCGEVHGLRLIGAALKGELRVLDVEESKREGERAGYVRLPLLEELQLDSNKLHSEEEPGPHFSSHRLEGGGGGGRRRREEEEEEEEEEGGGGGTRRREEEEGGGGRRRRREEEGGGGGRSQERWKRKRRKRINFREEKRRREKGGERKGAEGRATKRLDKNRAREVREAEGCNEEVRR